MAKKKDEPDPNGRPDLNHKAMATKLSRARALCADAQLTVQASLGKSHRAVSSCQMILDRLEMIRKLLDTDWYMNQKRGTPQTQSPYYDDPSAGDQEATVA